MGKRLSRSTLRPMSNMNLTSMMDCVWLLLITFIITFPMIEQSIPVNLPAAKGVAQPPSTKTATITVDKEGRIYLNDAVVTETDLSERLAMLKESNSELSVLFRADETVAYGHVVAVLKVLYHLGITKTSFVTRES